MKKYSEEKKTGNKIEEDLHQIIQNKNNLLK